MSMLVAARGGGGRHRAGAFVVFGAIDGWRATARREPPALRPPWVPRVGLRLWEPAGALGDSAENAPVSGRRF